MVPGWKSGKEQNKQQPNVLHSLPWKKPMLSSAMLPSRRLCLGTFCHGSNLGELCTRWGQVWPITAGHRLSQGSHDSEGSPVTNIGSPVIPSVPKDHLGQTSKMFLVLIPCGGLLMVLLGICGWYLVFCQSYSVGRAGRKAKFSLKNVLASSYHNKTPKLIKKIKVCYIFNPFL